MILNEKRPAEGVGCLRLSVGRGSRLGGGLVLVDWAGQPREGLAHNPGEMSSLPYLGPHQWRTTRTGRESWLK